VRPACGRQALDARPARGSPRAAGRQGEIVGLEVIFNITFNI